MGAKARWPDIVITTPPVLGYRGVALELKCGDNDPSPEQFECLSQLDAHGWLVGVCRTLDEVSAFVAVCWPQRALHGRELGQGWQVVNACRGK